MTENPTLYSTPDSAASPRPAIASGRAAHLEELQHSHGPHGSDETNLLAVANVLLKRWKRVAGAPLAAALVTALVSLLLPKQFTATATFIPEAQMGETGLPGSLRGLALQFGVGMTATGGPPAKLYANVMESRTLSDQILRARFPDPRTDAPADSATLLDVLEIEGDSEAERLELGREILASRVSVGLDEETSVVSVSARTPDRALSANVANRYVELLLRFNVEIRQSNVKSRRQFIENRMAEAELALWTSEEALQTFLQRNREFRGAPQLEVQYERLQRQVALRQEVLVTLSRQYEEARIQEVNDTPMITVLDLAVPPVEKSRPRRTLMVFGAFFLVAAISVGWAFAAAGIEDAQVQHEGHYQEFISHWRAFTQELQSTLPFRRSKKHP